MVALSSFCFVCFVAWCPELHWLSWMAIQLNPCSPFPNQTRKTRKKTKILGIFSKGEEKKRNSYYEGVLLWNLAQEWHPVVSVFNKTSWKAVKIIVFTSCFQHNTPRLAAEMTSFLLCVVLYPHLNESANLLCPPQRGASGWLSKRSGWLHVKVRWVSDLKTVAAIFILVLQTPVPTQNHYLISFSALCEHSH